MKKSVCGILAFVLILSIFSFSSIFAFGISGASVNAGKGEQQNQEGSENQIQFSPEDSNSGNVPNESKIREQNEFQLRVNEGDGKIKQELKFIDADGSEKIVDSEVEIEEESDEGGNIVAKFSNGTRTKIKIMPSTASQRAIQVLEQNNFTIQLKEVAINREQNRIVYEATAEKEGKFLGLFKAKANVKTQIDSETGEVLSTKKPWWFSY